MPELDLERPSKARPDPRPNEVRPRGIDGPGARVLDVLGLTAGERPTLERVP
jgi:hypothetical protein